MNFRTIIIVALSAFISFSGSSAQETFQVTFGGTGVDYGYAVKQTMDSGYIVAGYTTSFGAGNRDVYLIRTDKSGQKLWSKTYGAANIDYAWTIDIAVDGGFLIGAHSGSFGAGSHDIYLIKCDSVGLVEWTKVYGGGSADGAYSLQQTADGGYIVSAHTSSFGAGQHDVYLIKINNSGDTLWTRAYGGTSGDYLRAVHQTVDGGYVLVAETFSFGAGSADVYLLKTDSLGKVMWTKTYGGSSSDYGYSVKQTFDGGFIIAGFTNSFGAGQFDLYVTKTDMNGVVIWSKTYGGASSDYGHSVIQTLDSGYVICGYTLSFGMATQVYLVKLDSDGNLLWSKTYGGSGNDFGWSVEQTTDSGFVITGNTDSFGRGNRDVYLIKTDRFGNSGCHEAVAATIVSDAATITGSTQTLIDSGAFVNSTATIIEDVVAADSLLLCDNSVCLNCVRGDTNNDNNFNILDLTFLVDFIFRGGSKPACSEEADINNDAIPSNILDLTFIVDFIFRGGQTPAPC